MTAISMETFVWWVDRVKWKGGWNSVWMASGGPFATMLGQTWMQLLCAHSYNILELVSLSACLSYFLFICLSVCLSVCLPACLSVCLSVGNIKVKYSADFADAMSELGASFGQGSGAIHLDSCFCLGGEGRRTDCIHRKATRCTHAQDAGVTCSAGTCLIHWVVLLHPFSSPLSSSSRPLPSPCLLFLYPCSSSLHSFHPSSPIPPLSSPSISPSLSLLSSSPIPPSLLPYPSISPPLPPSFQLPPVLMVIYVWWVDPTPQLGVWRCASTSSLGLCVMTSGTIMMPGWCVGSWGSTPTVSSDP